MKKLTFIIMTLFVFSIASAQNVVINNQTNSGDCGFRINGICSSQDIGGVEIDIRRCHGEEGWISTAGEQVGSVYIAYYYLFATNYNPFTVTTIIAVNVQGRQSVYNAVIPANSVKVFELGHCRSVEPCSVIGSITRKLAR